MKYGLLGLLSYLQAQNGQHISTTHFGAGDYIHSQKMAAQTIDTQTLLRYEKHVKRSNPTQGYLFKFHEQIVTHCGLC